MKISDRELITLYLETSYEELETSIGRVLLAADNEMYRAGDDEIEKIKEIVNRYFEKNKTKLIEIICKKIELHKLLSSDKFNFELEGAVIIAEILEYNDFIPVPLSYPLLAAWLMRKKVYELCE